MFFTFNIIVLNYYFGCEVGEVRQKQNKGRAPCVLLLSILILK
jgi:hypothetical protein